MTYYLQKKTDRKAHNTFWLIFKKFDSISIQFRHIPCIIKKNRDVLELKLFIKR